jgi:BirA family biotin operon repressor/biotin-[acetyl-CoA-carboxylase] ligase
MVNKWLFEHLPSSPSTNSDLMNRWRNDQLTSPISLIADEQTSGRGRRGKSWISSKDSSLTFSIAYPFNASKGMPHLSGLSLFCGLALMKGLATFFNTNIEKLYSIGLGLKWPNDLLFKNAKLAGLLVEGGQSKPSAPIWMIIGIGINLKPTLEKIDSDYATTSLHEISNHPLDRIALWKSLTQTFAHELDDFDLKGFAPYHAIWNQLNLFQNLSVCVQQEHKAIMSGICKGVNTSGAIEIMTSSGLETLHSGDISLRLQHD